MSEGFSIKELYRIKKFIFYLLLPYSSLSTISFFPSRITHVYQQ